MKIILHIGLEKTGTTSLQKAFRLNGARLAEQGVLVPRCAGLHSQMGFVFAACDDDRIDNERMNKRLVAPEALHAYRRALHEKLAAEIAAADRPRTLLISSEHLSSRLPTAQEIDRLKHVLAPFGEVDRVLVWLRDPVRLVPSFYAETVRVGSAQPLRLPGDQPGPRPAAVTAFDPLPEWLRYDRLLDRWAEVFGRERLRPRLFEAASRRGLLDDFMEAAGLPPPEGWTPAPELRRAAGPLSLSVLRLHNRLNPRFVRGARNPLWVEPLIERLLVWPGRRLMLTPAQEARLRETYAETARRLLEDWFPERDELYGQRRA